MQIDVRTDLKAVQLMFAGMRRDQIPFATAYALTKTAQDSQIAIEQLVSKTFDRPTPYTSKPVYVKSATKHDLRAEVKLKDRTAKGTPADRYLIHHIIGSTRQHKGFEKQLINAGLMPSGYYAIPSKSTTLDAYGNISKAVIKNVLSQLQASSDSKNNESVTSRIKNIKKANRKRLARYFVASPSNARTSHLASGIYERVTLGFGSAIRPVFIYSQGRPKYRKRFYFYETVNKTIETELAKNFEAGYKLASFTVR